MCSGIAFFQAYSRIFCHQLQGMFLSHRQGQEDKAYLYFLQTAFPLSNMFDNLSASQSGV